MANLEKPSLQQWEELRLLGESEAMLNLRDQICRCARTDNPILILGERGTGKEQVAHACHVLSRRGGARFVAVNCAAFSETLIESELFGHVRGAYTGATHDREGRFEYANDGSIFLDEIGSLHTTTQVKLLRPLQEKSIEKVGANECVKVNARVIAATNEDIPAAILGGRMRSDFYDRISFHVIQVPALRSRGNDILLLANTFLAKECSSLNLKSKRLSESACQKLLTHHWPGNVRDLQKLIAKAVESADDDSNVLLDEFITFDATAQDASVVSQTATDQIAASDETAREAIAQRTVEILVEGGTLLAGLQRGSHGISPLLEDLVAGVARGVGRYVNLDNGQGQRDLQSRGPTGFLNQLGIGPRSGNRSLIISRIKAAVEKELKQ